MRHHLLKVRVADEEIGQAAGVLRAGAGEFGRRRRAVRHGIAGIGGQPGANLIGHAGRRVEVVVAVIAGQVAAVLVIQIDLRRVEPAGQRQRQARRQVQRVGEVQAISGVGDRDAHRRVGAGFVDHHAGSDEHAVERRQAADERGGAEHGLRAVEAEAGDEVVLQAEHVVGVGHLHRRAVAVGVGGLVVQLRVRAAVQEVRDEAAAQRGAETPGSEHSRPEPSLHGVSFGALPLVTRCRK